MRCIEERDAFDKDMYTAPEEKSITNLSNNKNEKQNVETCVGKTLPVYYERVVETVCNDTDINENIVDTPDIIKNYIQTSSTHEEDIADCSDSAQYTSKIKKNNTALEFDEIAPLSQQHRLEYGSDKATQVDISYCDKECNTEKDLEEYFINDDYILINGPLYIRKTALNANRSSIVCDISNIGNVVSDNVNPEQLIDKKTVSLDALCSSKYNLETSLVRDSHFGKLLNSDYDLTPQRDENTEKYHHLLVDATTSITNFSASNSNLNPETLLLTDNYLISNKSNQRLASLNEEKLDDDASEKLPCSQENDYTFSTNEISSDGQYEIKSYTIPKEINNCVGISGYSINNGSERDLQSVSEFANLSVSLTAYEIKSESSYGSKDVGKEIPENLHIGRMVNSNEGDSVVSSVRSEKSQSSSSATTHTKHILGKRKLNHPS